MKTGKIYEAKVEEVHSGDDLILMVNLGIDGLFKRTRVRLNGVDTPNAYKAKPETEAGRVRDEVKRLTAGRCQVEVVSEGKGGWLVNMFVFDEDNMPVSLNATLRERGYSFIKAQEVGT